MKLCDAGICSQAKALLCEFFQNSRSKAFVKGFKKISSLTDRKNVVKINSMWVQGNVVRKNGFQKSVLAQCEISAVPFSQENYIAQIEQYGMDNIWRELCDFLISGGIQKFSEKIVDFYEIGRLYEAGLAYENKFSKKQCGKYYTPRDVSALMARLFCRNKISAIADVGCGCGNLIVAVLEELEKIGALELVVQNGIYIFDNDKIALEICSARIRSRFGILENQIHKIYGDFLSLEEFPENISVIANPPYVSNCRVDSGEADVARAADLYIAFFSKICDFAQNVTIVTPQSFIVGNKFSMFRKKLNENFYGEIFSFDNVPCPLFNGKKEGVFNTNNANGVRASISNLHKKNENSPQGFRLSHLIRFKSEQREKVIDEKFLESTLGKIRQDLSRPIKAFKSLEKFAFEILENHFELEELLSDSANEFSICVATSARYFISASKLRQKRSGFFELFAKDKKSFDLLYALLNSSYCYMWYRFFDGGILLSKSLLKKIPVPRNLKFDDAGLSDLVSKIIAMEENCKSYKKNGGAIQEVVKFPESTRNSLNELLFEKIDFSPVHRNYEV